MQLDKFLLGLLLFSLVMTSGTFVFAGLRNAYDIDTTPADVGLSDVYNISDEIYADASAVKNETLNPEIEGGDESWESLVKKAYKAMGLVPQAVNLFTQVILAVSETLHIPSYLVGFAIGTMMIVIVFSILTLVFRFR